MWLTVWADVGCHMTWLWTGIECGKGWVARSNYSQYYNCKKYSPCLIVFSPNYTLTLVNNFFLRIFVPSLRRIRRKLRVRGPWRVSMLVCPYYMVSLPLPACFSWREGWVGRSLHLLFLGLFINSFISFSPFIGCSLLVVVYQLAFILFPVE